MQLTDRILTTLYADIVAILLLVGIFVLARSHWKKGDTEGLLFRLMFLFSMLNAVGNGVSYALRNQSFAGAKTMAMAACTILEASVLLLLFVWLTYVDFALYHSKDHLMRAYKIWFLPIGVFVALLFINMPTGILFSINDEATFSPHAMFRLIEITEYVYLVASFVVMIRYNRRHGNPRFFKAWSFLAPILIGSLVTDFTYYSLRSLGIAIGLVTLFFSMENYRRFLDVRSGFYNMEYMRWLFAYEDTRERLVGAVRIRTEGDEGALLPVLKQEAPEGAELVHVGRGEFLLLSDSPQRSVLQFLGQVIADAAEDAGVEIREEAYLRKKEETPEAFAARLSDICGAKTDGGHPGYGGGQEARL